ncbi:MAG TPA: amidohydrolase [Streptosporangiaceae bacterium]
MTAEGTADLVLTGGAVYTVDAAQTWAHAVAVKDGRIAAVGTDADMRPYVGPGTEVVNLRGRMLLPGFQDAHVHASGGGLERSQCDLTGEHTRAGYLAAIRSYADRNPHAEWIAGGGWGMDVFPGGVPSKEDLDAVVPDRPVFLSNRDHHGAWVNSRALALAGVDATTPDPPDGRIERTTAGEPQGTLHEGAMNLIRRVAPAVTLDEQVAGILEGQRYLHSLGITAWQEAIVGEYAVVPDCFDAYREVERQGLLTARVTGALWWQRAAGLSQLDFLAERRSIADGSRFRTTSVKIMQDGVCENFTAAMLSPYLDGHGHETDGRGTSFFDADELKEAVTAIDAQGFQVHIHAIGDRAVREALDAIAAARSANGLGRGGGAGASFGRGGGAGASRAEGRHHIAHLQVIHPEDVPRFRDLSVVANCQPLWASNEPQMTELTLPFLGPERSAWQYPFGSLARSGAQLCFGSDWPVSSPNPMWEMHTAVNRTTAPDYPFRGPDTGTPFLPGERIGLPAAIAAFTIGSAYVNHDERDAGSVEAGKRADLVVLDRDLFAQPAAEIAEAEVDLTLVDGTVVHARPGT